MQEKGWDDGRFVVIEEPPGQQGKYSSAHIHDMAACGLLVRSILPKHGYRDAVAAAQKEADRMNEDDRAGVR